LREISDNELLFRLKESDVQAFTELYKRYNKPVYNSVLKIIKDPVAAEDILQDAFVSLWDMRQRLEITKSLTGWLFTVSYNKAIAYLKKTLNERFLDTVLYESMDDGVIDRNLTHAKEEQRLSLIEQAIGNLSEQKRKVFELCKLYGKTYEEAAAELGISKHTIKEYLGLAMKQIREYVKAHSESLFFLLVLFCFLFCP
jgi:RNA polymerase sigma-70 factor (ECF subfamily)